LFASRRDNTITMMEIEWLQCLLCDHIYTDPQSGKIWSLTIISKEVLCFLRRWLVYSQTGGPFEEETVF